MILKSINPFTNEVIKEFEETPDEMVKKVLAESGEAFEKWKRTGIEDRASLMEKAAELLRSNINEYAGSITLEMGKPLKESRAEVDKCALVCEYYAKNAKRFLSPEY